MYLGNKLQVICLVHFVNAFDLGDKLTCAIHIKKQKIIYKY